MKISLDELKRAVNWISENTADEFVRIIKDERKIYLTVFDPAEREVEITIASSDLNAWPTIKKTERL